MERIDIIDSVYESIQGNYRSVEALMSSLYDKHLQNPEDVKQANLPNLDDRYDSLNEGMSTLMSGKSK